MTVYFISGLGAGKKAFQNVNLPAGYQAVYLDWITPVKNESLSEYARRFSELINEEKFILIGLSFGGMMASEIAKIKTPERVIIISSIAESGELPWYYRSAGKLNLHNLVPMNLLKGASILKRLFTAETREIKAVLNEYARTADPFLVRWSLNAMLKWEHKGKLPCVVQLHGTADRLLPLKYTHPDFKIKKGGHLMVLNRSSEINKILEGILLHQPITEAMTV